MLKALLIAAALAGTLSLALVGRAATVQEADPPTSWALTFTSKAGDATVTMTCDMLPATSSEQPALRMYKVFGAYIDEELGLIGSALTSFGSPKKLFLAAELPKNIKVELGMSRAVLSPVEGDWAKVKQAADLKVSFEPIQTK